MREYLRLAVLPLVVTLCVVMFQIPVQADDRTFNPENDLSLIPASQPRLGGVHNAGNLRLPLTAGHTLLYEDPETGRKCGQTNYPTDSGHKYIYAAAIWIGGVIGEDTLVATGFDPNYGNYSFSLSDDGGMFRTGCLADDEFVAVFTDTMTGPDPLRIPLNVELTQTSHSWRDSAYNDFVIITYNLKNIGQQVINDGWIGLYADPDIHDTAGIDGYYDDISGVLDTLLYDDDPASQVLIPYAFDDDGDPWYQNGLEWDEKSVRGIISFVLLGSSIENPIINYNWWWRSSYYAIDFGPRRLGTPEDPFREFENGNLGAPRTAADIYYILSHREIDYPSYEIALHDSSDGWVPFVPSAIEEFFDIRMLYSFGSFDLAPGDSVAFTVSVIAGENLHVNPADFQDFYNPLSPHIFVDRLDFSDLLRNHRRADSVYRSGLTLPKPGPPVGLTVTDYDADFVRLAWNPGTHPALRGYCISVVDTAIDYLWRHVATDPVSDTEFVAPVIFPDHQYFYAVSTVDSADNESARSFALAVVPGRARTPCDFSAVCDRITPVLSWQPYCDTCLLAYLIYRAVGDNAFALYDSTTCLQYRDIFAESGVQYRYRVSAVNDLKLESPPTDPIILVPMACNRGVLFYDMNYDNSIYIDPYRKEYVDELFASVRHAVRADYHDIQEGPITLKRMADYPLVIFDGEKEAGHFYPESVDSIHLYLKNGGKALCIVTNASTRTYRPVNPTINRYTAGSLFHDFLHLDSSLTNGLIFNAGTIFGDLTGCASESDDYPPLIADPDKLFLPYPLTLDGYLPLSGCLFPRDDVEILYRYQSIYTDSLFHGQINGIKCLSDSGSVVLFNFPLALMDRPAGINAFQTALIDLGVDLTCGDINMDGRFNIGDAVTMIKYLYQQAPPPPDPRRADVNCDGIIDLADALAMINLIFKNGCQLCCCPEL